MLTVVCTIVGVAIWLFLALHASNVIIGTAMLLALLCATISFIQSLKGE